MAHGIQEASGDTGVPMAFGVLTTDSWEQAEERAGAGRDNKGFEAAAAAIEMAQLFRRLHQCATVPGSRRHDARRRDRSAPGARVGAADALSGRSRPHGAAGNDRQLLAARPFR